MAIKLNAAYSKKAGLPGYSSHQFSVSIETELQSLDHIAHESTRLYESLQQVVDKQLQKTGFVPPNGYGMEQATTGEWQCSPKQKQLIEKIIDENKLDAKEIDNLAHERFDAGLEQLNKLQASGLIDELLERHGNGHHPVSRGSRFRRNGVRGATA